MITAMKTVLKYVAMAAIATTVLSSCSNEEELLATGEGTVYLSTSVNSDVKVRSRATLDELRQSAMVWISNSKGVVRQFDNANAIPSEGVKLLADKYVAEAWAGDSVPASFEYRYFKGQQEFTIVNNDKKSVEIVCKIANSVVTVSYADEIDALLRDYTLTVGHSQGSLDYVGRTDAKGYFMMNSRDKDLTWTLTGTKPSGEVYSRTGVIEGCKPATQYNIVIKCSEDSGEIGGAYFTIEIDETAVDVEDEITIVAAPEVRGVNVSEGTLFNLPSKIQGEVGSFKPFALWITGSAKLQSLILTSTYFNTLLGLDPGVNDFDMLYPDMDPGLKQKIAASGILCDVNYDDVKDESTIRVLFDETFTNALPEGEYTIEAEAVDVNGKHGKGTLTVSVGQGGVTPPSDDVVSTDYAVAANIWSTKATITGKVNNSAEAVEPRLVYRKRGITAWTEVSTSLNGSTLTAQLSGLEPGTDYEYCAVSGDFYASVMSFTTEAAAQFPNFGFEEWHEGRRDIDKKDLWLIYGSNDEMFWDCGNHGSITMNKNVTNRDESIKNSGTYSIKLESQFVGFGALGKFAAGNVFVGEYLKTDGTDGVLGWGRAWSSRPARLHGWVKYTPQAVTNDNPDYSALKKGDMDKGILYIALLDNSVNQEFEGKNYPVVVKTKKAQRQLFDKNGSNVIAYGEIVFSEATAGDGLVEFEVPLVYKRTDVKPSYILCTASASIGGDYFVGGPSTMWLDDLELIYE